MRRLLAAAWLAAAAGCIYTTKSSLPERIRTVRLEPFENRTAYPGLDAELLDALARRFLEDGRLRPAGSGADAVLEGRITAVRRSVIQEDAYDDVVTGRVVIEAEISFHDLEGEVVMKRELVTSRDGVGLDGVFRLRRAQTEGEALAAAVDALARNMVRRVLEDW